MTSGSDVSFLLTLVLLGSRVCAGAAAEDRWPGTTWSRLTPADAGMDEARLRKARDYALTGGGSGFVVRGGGLVFSWGDPKRRYDLKSTTKSIGITALGLALKDGKLRLSDRAVDHLPRFGIPPPANAKTGWLPRITLLHLATQTAGFAKPGGYERLLFPPGTQWSYSDGGPNWLADILTSTYHRDLKDLLFERVFSKLGITTNDLTWRANAYRPHLLEGVPRREFGSGISADVDAMARIGLLYLRKGRGRDEQLLPEGFVDRCATTVPSVIGLPEHDPKKYGNASDHYGLLWWNNADGTLSGVPRDAFWSWGLHESLILVIPSLALVVTRAGRAWQRNGWGGHYDVLAPFFLPLVASTGYRPAGDRRPPYPRSRVLPGIAWAPPATIIRKARGSDNWPLTWGDDDALYTAYGDGWGFEPKTSTKLSLGFARIRGTPPHFAGENLRAPSGETVGHGPHGKKASGILMVEGVLYLWVRNAGNSQLAWSRDHGATWRWADWKFTTSFGCPTFLNFGKNYAGARDDFVYVYSPDTDTAYAAADRMVLARVPKNRITDRAAYRFFEKLEAGGNPVWTADLARRGAVFTHPGRCYRSGITYAAALKRYLWCQTLPGDHLRTRGGFGIYDAPEPWGPWTTVFFTENWDVGPGESCRFPTKWMSSDGKTVYLVFSGEDSFSVRQATLHVTR